MGSCLCRAICGTPAEKEEEKKSEKEKKKEKKSDSGAERQEERLSRAAEFQEAVSTGSKYEPYSRHIGEVPAPFPRKSSEVPELSSFEESPSIIEHKEQDQNLPSQISLAEIQASPSETIIPKPGEQLSILPQIDNNEESCEEEQPVQEQTDKEPKAVKTCFIQKTSEAEVKRESIWDLQDVLTDKVVKVVALKLVLSKNLAKPVLERLLQSEELEDHDLPNVVEGLVVKERRLSSKGKPDINHLKEMVTQNLQSQLLMRYSEQHIIPETGLAGNDQKACFSSSDDLVKKNKDLLYKEKSSPAEKPVSQPAPSCRTESVQDSQEGPADLKSALSKTSLEIIRVIIPSSTETESTNDVLIEKLLKEEKSNLKSCLCKRPQDIFKDQYKYHFPETGLRTRESNICQVLCSGMTGEQKTALEKALFEEGQVSKQGLAGVPVLNGNIKDIVLETLSENNITNLNSIWTEKAQNNLLKRLSNMGSILEEELEKIVENLSWTVTETQLEELQEPDLIEGGQIPTTAESLLDRFTEEELQNLKSALGKLTKKGHRVGLSDSEVESLTSILQKSFDDLPMQSSSETGINKVVEIKDEFPSLPLSTTDVSTSTTGIDEYDRGRYRVKEKTSSASEMHRGDNTDFPEQSLYEVETTDKETQTNDILKPLKKLKHTSKKESHRLQNPPEKDMPSSQKGVEPVVKSKAFEETLQQILSEYYSLPFLSAHDIGMQNENRGVAKPSNPISKPPFPVNPQTFLLLHSDPHEDTKSPGNAHQKAGKKKSGKSKKDMASSYQAAMINPQLQREGASSSKETLRGQKYYDLPSPKQSLPKSRKESTLLSSSGAKRKESLKLKSVKKEFRPKKSFSKTYLMADLPQPDLPLAAKSSVTNYLTFGFGKGNTEFQEAVFSGSTSEPFLRDIGEVPAPFPRKSSEVPELSSSEESPPTIEHKEREYQDPPYQMSLAEIHTSPSETEIPKPGRQLSILQLIDNNGESCEEEQPIPKRTAKEPRAVKTCFIRKTSRKKRSKAEVKRENICFKRNFANVRIDKAAKVVRLKSQLSKKLEKPISEKHLQTEISQELEDRDLPNVVEGLECVREKHLLKERRYKEKPDINNLQNLQSQLLGRDSEQYIIPGTGLAGNDQKASMSSLPQVSCRKKEKESHWLQNPLERPIPDMPSSQKGVGSVVKSKASKETLQQILSEYSFSSFLSAPDIGMQNENREVAKPSNPISKPPFPVNPQTLLLLHSDPHEDTKSPGNAHQKAGKKKSGKSKKVTVSPYQAAMINPQLQREGASSSKKTLRGEKYHDLPSPKQSLPKSRKDSKLLSSSGAKRKESLKLKSVRKLKKEFRPKKSISKTYFMADLPQPDLPLAAKSSVSKYPIFGFGKGNTEKPGDDPDLDSFKHLEKAIERALQDLGRGPGKSPSQTFYSSRPYAFPSISGLSREPGTSLSTNNSASGNPSPSEFSSISMLQDKLRHSTMTPAQLDEILKKLL